MLRTTSSSHLPLRKSVAVRRPDAAPVILIAEDDPIMSALLSDFLRSRGFATLVAVDAMQTVMYATRGQPSLILLDINMPGGSGVHALQKIRDNALIGRTPVIAISGSTDPQLGRTLFDLGVDVFVQKPIDLEMLAHRIRGRLDGLTLSA